MTETEIEPIPQSPSRRRLLIGVVVLVLALALAGGVAVVTINGNAEKGVTATEVKYALCVLRADLQTRADSSRQFLVDHPHGIPGIPAKTIQDGIRNQERTIRALSTLDC